MPKGEITMKIAVYREIACRHPECYAMFNILAEHIEMLEQRMDIQERIRRGDFVTAKQLMEFEVYYNPDEYHEK